MTLTVAISIFAGLGLFFIGVKLITSSLTQLASLKLRAAVRKATGNRWLSAMIGTVAGAVTQSNNAVTFITVGLVSSGVMQVRQGLPLIAWTCVGTSVLVFIATVDIHDAVLALVGIAGSCYFLNLDKSPRFRHMVGALLGVALLFQGLEMIREASVSLRNVEGLREFLVYAHGSPWLAFALGAALTPVVQTAKTVSAIAVAMVSSGLLSIDQAIMIVLGANFSSCLNVAFMSANIVGTSRQLSLYQAGLKVVGVAGVLPFFLLDYVLPGKPALSTLALVGDSLSLQVAVVYLLVQVVALLLTWPFEDPLLRLLARLAPPTVHETLSRPKYISEHALLDAVTAADLAEREQLRQVGFLAGYLATVREEADEGAPAIPLAELRDANSAVMRDTDAFLKSLLTQNLHGVMLERVITLQNRNGLLASLQDSLHQFAGILADARRIGIEHRLFGHLAETLHLILTTLPAALAGDRDDAEFLQVLTGDKTDLMENIRRTLMHGEGASDPGAQDVLFNATTLFERIVWLVRRFAILADSGRETDPKAAAPA
ncbi:MAG: Na/Pi symporter [Magnetospirillum sp. WYHS-4]